MITMKNINQLINQLNELSRWEYDLRQIERIMGSTDEKLPIFIAEFKSLMIAGGVEDDVPPNLLMDIIYNAHDRIMNKVEARITDLKTTYNLVIEAPDRMEKPESESL